MTNDLEFRTFSNGCLPNEIYYLIIDCLADHQEDIEIHRILQQCLLVCKVWSQRASKSLIPQLFIKSVKQLLQYGKVVNSSFSRIHTLSLFIETSFLWGKDRSCSVIGTTLLLISKLTNLQQLDISCKWYNDYHPKILKLLSNTSVKSLCCKFALYADATQSVLEFITHFQSLQFLSLEIFVSGHANILPLKMHRPFRRALRETKICLKELHLRILDSDILKLVVNAFMGANDFAAHISKHGHSFYAEEYDHGVDINVYQKLLAHCSGSLQVLSHEGEKEFRSEIIPGNSQAAP